MKVIIMESARKHGVKDEDMLHAYRHPIRVHREEGVAMLVGADRSGRLLEVATAERGNQCRIIHAMAARARFLR